MAYCTMEKEVIGQQSVLALVLVLPSFDHKNKLSMCVCVTVSDTSVVEGESQIQMGRFISFLQVSNE